MRRLSALGNQPHEIATAINDLIGGNNNATNNIVLESGTSSSFESDQIGTEINEFSFVELMPMSLAASVLKASGNLFVSEIINGAFTLTHPTSNDGLEYRIVVLGGSGL